MELEYEGRVNGEKVNEQRTESSRSLLPSPPAPNYAHILEILDLAAKCGKNEISLCGKWKHYLLSRVGVFATPWIEAPLSVEFSRQEYWSR